MREIFFILCCVFLAAAREYSGVVVNKTTGNPVEGVLVSVGHSEYYTRTDKNGKFSITDPTPEGEPLPEPPTAISKAKLQNARWNFQGRSLDLRTVPGVSSVSIYTTNGKRVFNGQVPSSRIVALPSMAMGIYILELNGERGVIDRGSTKLAKDAVDSERLIFRQDDYLPKDIDMTNSNTDMRVELKPDERSSVFDQSKVHEYRFTIDANDLNYMNTYGYREEFKPAELKYNNSAISGKIGIRYKGSEYTLPRCFGFNDGDTSKLNVTPRKTCDKISYKLKFTEYDKEKRFYGLKKINLHAMTAQAEPTKMHEMLSYELFRDMGIHAPRTSYANVYINNNLIGLFVAVEEIDGRFTKSRWPDYGDGNLYKEVWPKNDTTKYYLNGLKTNNDPEDNPNVQKMVSYYKAINASNAQNYEQNLSPYMDFDYFLRYLVVDVAIKNWDGLRSWYIDHLNKPGPNNHNYFYYEEETSNGKIWLIPWDMDQALVERDNYFDAGGGFPGGGFPGGGALPQWNVSTTNCGGQQVGQFRFMPPNCDKLTKLMANQWARYVQLGDLFLKDLFISQRLNDKITKHSNLINNAVQQDPYINQGTWTNGVNSLKNYLPNSISSFRSYLHP
jgi:spore coat protein CotH